jgi:Ca-activated chloride channel family protein
MIEFAWIWVWAVLPLPWLVRWVLRPQGTLHTAALRVPFLDDFALAPQAHRLAFGGAWPLWLAALAWVSLVAAAARPQWLGAPTDLPVTGRDIMLAVDLSRSMQQTDLSRNGQTIDRLTAVKFVADKFIDRRVGDRIGLILFGERAYLQAPLTFDRKTVKTLLNEASIGLAGDATAIGDAIGLAVKRFREQKGHDHVLILLTDGANTAGVIDPLKAAEIAAKYKLKIYTIGIGAESSGRPGIFGGLQANPSLDLDEKSLKAIARITGGRYFRARDLEELDQIYAELDKIEPAIKDTKRYRPITALYPWPLGLALLLGAGLLWRQTRGAVPA